MINTLIFCSCAWLRVAGQNAQEWKNIADKAKKAREETELARKKELELRMGATHPSHRRQGHSTARLMLLGEFAYNHLGCTGTQLEIVNTDQVSKVADTWRSDISADETQRDTENKFGDAQTYTLNKIQITAAEHETHRAGHSTWGSVTYTIT